MVARQAHNLSGRLALVLIATTIPFAPTAHAALSGARVVADEIITTTMPANNGSSPMWSVGAPLLVRENGNVWASISVTDPEAKPACNTHWELWRKPAAESWERFRAGPAASEREPCPLFLVEPDKLLLSIHPKILERSRESDSEKLWFCQPAIARFDPTDLDDDAKILQPEFATSPVFNQHTYRSMAVDTRGGAFLMMVIGYDNRFHTTWRDADDSWKPVTAPEFPIRACYATLLLSGSEGYVFAIGDIVEPNPEWKAEKFRVLERNWDYAFRRVFYARSPDLAKGRFDTPVEVDSVDDTAGWAFNLDMAFDSNGRVHLLWVRQNIQYAFMRDRFFQGTPIEEEVRHAVLDDGRVISTETLLRREVEGETGGWRFSSGRFHNLPDGRLLAVLTTDLAPQGEKPDRALLLQELDLEARASPPAVRVELAKPPPRNWIFTNTTRGGSKPDNNLDILTTETKDGVISLRYIHVVIPD